MSDALVHFLTLGALVSTITSGALYFNHVYNSESILPIVSFEQCFYTSLSSLVLMLLSVLYWSDRLKLLRLNMPNVPSSVPYLGHAIRFTVQSPWDAMLQWHKQYGEIFAFPLMGRTMISLSSPDHLKIALQSKIHAVKKDVEFTYQPFMVILGKGIVTSEDKAWMKQRLKMSTALRINVLEIIPLITLKAVQRLMEKLDRAVEKGDSINLTESLRHLTLQVISNSFLSISFDESDSSFGKLYLPIVEECNQRIYHPYRASCFFLPFWWRHWNRVSHLNQYVSSLIQNRWEDRNSSGSRQNDILDLVLDAYEKEHKLQSKIPTVDLSQMRDEFKTFMLAGHETSAAMMTWALYEMMAKQSLADEVAKESGFVFNFDTDWATSDELPSLESLSNLVFAESCLKESLRKYSVVPLVIRRVVNELDLGQYRISPGSRLAINIQAVHHNPKYWPDPMTFDPHRFLNQKPAPYTFLPFLEGPRNCLGQHLSLLESKMVLALLTQRYQFRATKEINTELGSKSSDPRHQYIVPVTPKEDLYVFVSKRKPA